jgi:hypothetical protein
MAPKKKTGKKAKRTARKRTPPRATGRLLKKSASKKPTTQKTTKKVSGKKRTQKKSPRRDALAFSLEGPGSRSATQSGDLQGLSHSETADSESVEELLEEGNTFEAGAVIGVEDAESADEKEVRTHEVPEDDVPGEYLDKD